MSVFRISLLLGAVVCLPFLGSVGLWDPWETHYAEVGRQMLARADLVHPYWQNAWFFSKPPLVPWLAALGLFVSGAQPWGTPGVGPLPSWVEWLIRLPVALMLIVAIAHLSETVARTLSRRVGLLTSVVWWTMPLACFLARQLMTDGPFVACLVFALSCALREKWPGFFAAMGVATLAKGLLGFLPLVIVLASFVALDGRGAWKRVRTIPAWSPLLTLIISAPWYVTMSLFTERDDEGRRFVERFFGYDHLDRLVSGVHTTTPGGTFTYFLEQGAFAIAPWVLLIPLSMSSLSPRGGEGRGEGRTLITMALSSLIAFALFSASATRFHHYVFPVLPGLAVLLAVALDDLLTCGLEGKRPALLLGATLSSLVWLDLIRRPRHLLDLFTYNHDRPYPDEVLLSPPFKTLLTALLLISTAAGLISVLRHDARALVATMLSLAAVIALALSWHHWPALGAHWTQRELTRAYFDTRRPDEPLGAFLMNWKGETFYTRKEVLQLSARDPRAELSALAQRPGRAFVIVEHARVPMVRSLLPAQRMTPLTTPPNNKFTMLTLDD
jgi:4-amino-4-deoxy-L-arabinose transferase-like glycosyltransferase